MRRKHALTAAVVLLMALPAAAAAPGKLPPSNSTPPAISGDITAGQTLTASTGTWDGNGLKYTYQWQRCDPSGAACTDVGGATSSTYTTGNADVGSTLRVTVTATNVRGSASATSDPSGVIAPQPAAPSGAPANLTAPTISGTATVGSVLTASTGTWSGSPTAYSYQWFTCDSTGVTCSPISGATSSTYAPVSYDVGRRDEIQVSASNAAGSASAMSAATAVVGTAYTAPAVLTAPTITGNAVVGQTLFASTGTWSGTPTSYSYQWFYCDSTGVTCSAIAGANGSAYTPVVYDVGGRDKVRIAATNSTASTTADSSPTAIVQNTTTPPAPTGTYFNDDFESGFTKWSFEGSAATQLSSGTGYSGKGAALTNVASSSGPNSSSQLASLYLNPGSQVHASEGDDTWYRVRVFFPSDYQPTTGEWNWIVEWHDDAATTNECGLSCVSIALGVYTDYPVSTGYGQNPRLALRLSGGTTSSIVQKSIVLPSNSLLRNHWYTFVFHYVWSSSPTTGLAEWWADGVQQVSTSFPTLYRHSDGSSSINGFGLYNYRLSANWADTVLFDDVAVGPTQASVS